MAHLRVWTDVPCFLVCAILLFGRMGAAAEAEELTLKIVAGGSAQIVTKAQLAARLSPAEITVYSPVYQRQMTYRGFWLDQILRSLRIRTTEQDIVFECVDGYGTSMPAGDIGVEKWLVAYGEPEGWTPLPERHQLTTPGPWYVIGRESSSYQDLPWPYQVTAIKIQGHEF